MKCDTCVRVNDDKTKGTCEKCMAEHFKGNDDAFYEPMPEKKFKLQVCYDSDDRIYYKSFDNVINHYFMDKWLVVEGIGYKNYLRTDDIQEIEVNDDKQGSD